MAKLNRLNPLAATVGAAVVASALSAPVSAAGNPFASTDLGSGYQLAGDMEGQCGEGKCGAEGTDKKPEGSCGGGDTKDGTRGDKKGEGSCGGAQG